jgi:hypothetical protein
MYPKVWKFPALIESGADKYPGSVVIPEGPSWVIKNYYLTLIRIGRNTHSDAKSLKGS